MNQIKLSAKQRGTILGLVHKYNYEYVSWVLQMHTTHQDRETCEDLKRKRDEAWEELEAYLDKPFE